jgi:myo-inositol catabolism protein IolC
VFTIGYPAPLFLLAFGDAEDPPLRADQRAVLWDAVDRSLARVDLAVGEVGLLIGDDEQEVLAEVGARGLRRAVPVGRGDRGPFELAHGDDFARHLEESGAQLARVRLSWNPGHPPDDKKSQAMHLAKLAAWLHEADRKLLIDLDVPPVDADLEQVAGDRARWRAEMHPATTRRAVQEVRDLGVEPDVWITEPMRSVEDAVELTDVVHEAGREDVALLVADTEDAAVLRTAAGLTGYRGFVAGRSLWAAPFAALDAERSSRDEAVHAIDAAFRHRLELFRSATRG